MPGAEQLLGFVLAALAITATPGPDNLMVLGMGMSKGRSQGMAFGLGCAVGCLSHTALAVAGVSALVAASPTAFTLLRIVGGLYLMWLGVQSLRSAGGARAGSDADPDSGDIEKVRIVRWIYLKQLALTSYKTKRGHLTRDAGEF